MSFCCRRVGTAAEQMTSTLPSQRMLMFLVGAECYLGEYDKLLYSF